MARTTAATTAAKTTSRARAAAPQKSDETLLKELFVDELKDIYYAEKLLVKALPKMKKASTSGELAAAFEEHLAVTQNQISRIERVFEMLNTPAKAKKCEAMEGLVKEGTQMIDETPKGTMVRDAALIISAQKIEHYEIAGYGSLVQLAKTMGQTDVADLLGQTLDEEKQADQTLTELAVSGINVGAGNEEGKLED